MKKLVKSLALALTVALASICLGVFAAACGDKSGDEVYAVYVVYEDGTPVNGHTDGTGYVMGDDNETYISVKWCNANGCPNPVILGTDGKASIKVSEMEAAGFKEGDKGVPTYVEIIDLTEEYGVTYHKDIDGPGEITITLTKVN